MEDITYLVLIALISITTTIIVSVRKNIKKIYKYLPAIIVFIGSILYCIIMSIVSYNRYIGILYVVVFMTTLPGIILSLLTAFVFDITRFFIDKMKD